MSKKKEKTSKKEERPIFINREGSCPECGSVEYHLNYGGCGKSCTKCGEKYD